MGTEVEVEATALVAPYRGIGPTVDYPRDKCIHELFEAKVARTPGAVAVAFEDQQLTYRELNERADALANQLRERGVGPEVRVGICVNRSLEMMIGLVGILKAGGAYVPMDPTYPRERVAFMLQDSQAPVLLTQKHLLTTLPANSAKIICLNCEIEATQPATRNPRHCSSENLAYVLYTSGSTGKPKGVMVTHRNVVNFFAGMDMALGSEPGVWLAVTSISFDISVLELLWTLTRGFKVVIQPEEWSADLPIGKNHSATLVQTALHRSIAQQILHHDVTHFQCTPSQAALLVEDTEAFNALHRLKKFLVGGEALPQSLAQKLSACGELFNMYGPTETTIWSACSKISPGDSVTIGRPIANTQIYIVDEQLQPVRDGEAGELLIGGDGVARGYLNRPELTAKKFIPNQWSDTPSSHDSENPVYCTGDLARFRADGSIEFLGRLDHQVKIRGHRIELGEIENVLEQHPSVRQAVLLAREDQPGDQRLVAYVVPRSGSVEADEVATVGQWQTVWDGTYNNGSDEPDPTFNISGWRSSYTGEPIPAEEMREWVENTVERVLTLKPARVLEIGCGTGLLLFRIAPFCEHYCATDFSTTAIQRLKKILARSNPQLPVSLLQSSADDLSKIEPASFDTVIINSVAQYFPDADYMLRVVEGALRVVKPSGKIFLGDIRNLPLLEEFYASIELENADGSLTVSELKERIQRRAAQEKELVFAPEFFHALRQRLPQISRAEVLLKRGKFQNELTRFRYDVVLHVGEPAEPRFDSLDGRKDLLAQFINRPATSVVASQLSQELRQYLKAKLPEFMVPSALVVLDKLPLTPNGKVNRKALPKPVAARITSQAPFKPAESELEKVIAEIWQELLQVERVGLNDNFFDLGGHSLLLAQVHARLRDALKRDLPIIKLFQYPTIQSLANFLEERIEEKISFADVQNRARRQQASFAVPRPVRRADSQFRTRNSKPEPVSS